VARERGHLHGDTGADYQATELGAVHQLCKLVEHGSKALDDIENNVLISFAGRFLGTPTPNLGIGTTLDDRLDHLMRKEGDNEKAGGCGTVSGFTFALWSSKDETDAVVRK
jgi:hypothetical protein